MLQSISIIWDIVITSSRDQQIDKSYDILDKRWECPTLSPHDYNHPVIVVCLDCLTENICIVLVISLSTFHVLV